MKSPDYRKRGYLLPKGCKNLIDVVNFQTPQVQWQHNQVSSEPPPITGEILVSEKPTVGELAKLLGQKPFRIIADLMQLGVIATVKQSVDFESVCKVAQKYGYKARSPA